MAGMGTQAVLEYLADWRVVWSRERDEGVVFGERLFTQKVTWRLLDLKGGFLGLHGER